MTILIRSALRILSKRVEDLENRIEAEAKDAITRGEDAENAFLKKYSENYVNDIFELFQKIFDVSLRHHFIESGINFTIEEIHNKKINKIIKNDYKNEYDDTYPEE